MGAQSSYLTASPPLPSLRLTRTHTHTHIHTQLRELFQFFDEDCSGSVSYDEFLLAVRGELNDRRARLVDMAFNVVDKVRIGGGKV